MASNFPSSLDTFTNPSSTDAMDSVSVPHATQHSDLNDAVEALQAKVGADSSGVASSHDYKIAQLEGRDTAGLVLITATTFSAVSSVSVDGCFTSDYRNYRIVLENTNSTTSENRIRLRASSTDNTDAVYDRASVFASSGGTGYQNDVAQTAWRFDTNYAAVINSRSFDVFSPALAARTFVNHHMVETAGTDIFVSLSGLGHRNATAYDGFTYYAVSGTITGTLRIYGYED